MLYHLLKFFLRAYLLCAPSLLDSISIIDLYPYDTQATRIGTSDNLEPYPNSLHSRWSRVNFQGGCLRDIGSELGPEFCHVVGEERGLVAGAGDGDVAEARVEQVRVDTGIGVNEDALGGKALRAVTGNGVAVVKMTMLVGVEFDLAVVVEADGQAIIGVDCLDHSHVTICKTQ
jgi:hypothetical protein